MSLLTYNDEQTILKIFFLEFEKPGIENQYQAHRLT